MELTQKLVKDLFDYNDGFLYWKVVPLRHKLKVGDKAGCLKKHTNGDLRHVISIKRRQYYSSRLIFLWHKGYLPVIVDHENRNKLDDRIENLRAASHSQNGANKQSLFGSTSIYLGVSKSRKRWVACIHILGINTKIGSFNTQEKAALEYNKYAVMHHKEFANLNIIKKL